MEAVNKLNYHHLLYFYTVSKTGAVTAAAEGSRGGAANDLGSTTAVGARPGHRLFRRVGRGLELTEAGRVVQRYANDIFSIGDEMLQTLDGRPAGGRPRLRVGIADVLPKMAVAHVLEPLLVGEEAVHLLCY